jgi:hypothetical protein
VAITASASVPDQVVLAAVAAAAERHVAVVERAVPPERWAIRSLIRETPGVPER